MAQRKATVERSTKETQLKLSLNLDGEGKFKGSVGLPFLEHMFDLVARHGYFDLEIGGKGDLEVDCHHTVEDLGICFGEALKKAVGDKKGIARFGSAQVPLDEARAECVLDLSGRAFLAYDAPHKRDQIGNYALELTEHFFRSVVSAAALTLHLRMISGSNDHHIQECIFKSFARALSEAVRRNPREKGVPSTKGSL